MECHGPELAVLVREHYPLLYRYAYRLTGSIVDAEDITQQAFLTAQMKLDQLRDPQNAKSWLCTIVRNIYLKGVRDRNGSVAVSLELVAPPGYEPDVDMSLDHDELQAALNELTDEYRTPLILFYFEDFSYKKIAEQMGTPIGTVMSRLARAKSFLRRRLDSRIQAGAHS